MTEDKALVEDLILRVRLEMQPMDTAVSVVIARSEATKQSILLSWATWIASLRSQ
jgi:hypothetical protein